MDSPRVKIIIVINYYYLLRSPRLHTTPVYRLRFAAIILYDFSVRATTLRYLRVYRK